MANELTIPQKVKGASITFSVKVDGQAIPQTMQVYSATVCKEANRIPYARLVIVDGDPAKNDFPASSGDLFLPGKEIEIFAGHQSNEDPIFKGIVIRHAISVKRNGGSQLSLECRDKCFRMTLGRKSAYYTKVKDSDIASTLIGNYSLKTGTIEDSKSELAAMVQFDCSDWDFLVSRMDINGKLVIANDGAIDIKKPDFSSTPVLTVQYGSTILEFDAEMDARTQYKAVKAIAWDHSGQEVLEVSAQEPSAIKENGNFSSAKLAEVTGLSEAILRHSGHLSQEELQAWANAHWQKSRMSKIRGTVSFDGFAGIKPGDLLELKGLGDRFNGKVFASALRHDLSKGSWVTSVQFGMNPGWFAEQVTAASPPASLLPSIHGLHTAVVVQLEKDPAGEHRVLIRIPMVGASGDGIWARVAALDAGKERGSFFRPDIGDEVLVGFINNDPREAVILGMLHSSKLPAPLEAKDKNEEKGFFFTSKMKMLFSEKDKSMTFETPGGNKMIITEKSGSEGITLEDQTGNKILMNKDGITLESAKDLILKAASGDIKAEAMNVKQKASVDFEAEGVNVKLKAQAEFKAEGSAGAEVSSSAIAKLKGSLVQIN